MTSQTTVEQRLEALERDVLELRRRLDGLAPSPSWLDRVAGSMKDNPAFPEAMRLGAEFRRADRPADET